MDVWINHGCLDNPEVCGLHLQIHHHQFLVNDNDEERLRFNGVSIKIDSSQQKDSS